MENIELKRLMIKYEYAQESINTYLDKLIKLYELEYKYNPVEHIKTRIKSQKSATKKLERKGYEITTENIKDHIHDMVGFRVICLFLSDVYDIVDFIKKSNQFEIKEENDYIKNPKESGYKSYHLNVLIPIIIDNKKEYIEAEIQVRTVAMDFWASIDHKLRYKLGTDVPENFEKELFDCSQEIGTIDVNMQKLYEIVKSYKSDENNTKIIEKEKPKTLIKK